MKNDRIVELRRNVSIPWVWNYLGLSGKAARTCHSPFRSDKRASFSVWQTREGDKWRDQGTNEGGDVIDFWAKAKGVTIGQAITDLIGLNSISLPPVQIRKTKVTPSQSVQFREPTPSECECLGALRSLDSAAFSLAGALGTLVVGTHPATNELLWWLTDKSGMAFEGRTFDGSPTLATGKKVAAKNGTRKDFPVGLQTNNTSLDRLTQIVIVEGSADYFAALHMALRIGINFRTCAMLGACTNLCDEAVTLFNDTNVLIMAHNDEAGLAGATRWKDQLTRAKNIYVKVQPLPEGIGDLNDLMTCPLFSFKP